MHIRPKKKEGNTFFSDDEEKIILTPSQSRENEPSHQRSSFLANLICHIDNSCYPSKPKRKMVKKHDRF